MNIMEDLFHVPDEPIEFDAVLVPLRDIVVFPRTSTPLFMEEALLDAVQNLAEEDLDVVAVAQRDEEIDTPTPDDIFQIGTGIEPMHMLRLPEGGVSVMVQGLWRVRIKEFLPERDGLMIARVESIPEPEVENTQNVRALVRLAHSLYEKYVALRDLPEDLFNLAYNIAEPGWLADFIASSIDLSVHDRQHLLELLDPLDRLQRVNVLLSSELELLELQDRLHHQVQEEMDKTQREYFLREQLRIIQRELGERDPFIGEAEELRQRIMESPMPEMVREKALKELRRLEAMPPVVPEVGIIRTYLDWLLDLPWGEPPPEEIDLKKAAKVLDQNHYALQKAKERILEYLAVRQLAGSKMPSPILCFVGPPGTGKTSLGRSIAEALGRRFVRVSLGGVRDEAEIRGHRRTYIGAMPGRIIQGMRNAGVVNPVFMLDEIDKLGYDFRGDPASALLEVLDPEQNREYSDHYLEVPYDLSNVFFITTANVLHTIPPALLDRMEIIEFPGYTEDEKVAIAMNFLIPRQKEAHGLERYKVRISEKAVRRIIREYTSEAGVRNLERAIASIFRKLARRYAEGEHPLRLVTDRRLPHWLGPPQYTFGVAEREDEVGVATGVAVTEAGGDLLSIEVSVMPGKGNLTLTGQLGEVMQESAQAALTYARAHAEELGIEIDDFDKIDIHIHVPEGAIPKDGPSAGITMATALVSALTGRKVACDVAMTGEITLRGRVLPIGGLKEKALAAHRAGLKTLLIPKGNEKDLVDIPNNVRRRLNIVLVERMEQVLDRALRPPESDEEDEAVELAHDL
nr:endopeptidase La [Ardenticatena sp.]